jgi:hypothetical protein
MIYMDRKSEYSGDWHDDQYQGLGIIKDKYIEFRGEFDQGKMVRFTLLRSNPL